MAGMAKLSWYLGREWPSLILASVAVAMTLNWLIAPRGIRDLLVLRGHQIRLEHERSQLQADNSSLERNIRRLRSDDRYLQNMVRSELGLVRPGEIVYRFRTDAAPEP
jgi:cell division protein FtsB